MPALDAAPVTPAEANTSMMINRCCVTLLVWLSVVFAPVCPTGTTAASDTPLPPAISERLDPDGVAGTLVICGGGKIVDEARQAFARGVIADRPVVILATASANPAAAARSARGWLRQQGVDETVFAHLDPQAERSAENDPDGARDDADPGDDTARPQAETLERIAAAIAEAGGVWMPGGRQSRLARAYAGTVVEQQLKALLARGGVVGGTSAGAAIQCRTMIAGGRGDPKMARGLELLPEAIIDQHFSQRRRLPRLRNAVDAHPDHFGLGIDEATTVLVRGRRLETIGQGTVTVVLAAGPRREAIEVVMPAGALADLTQLRRSAGWRASRIDPGQSTAGPRQVSSGSLVIVGGGGMPDEVVGRFVALAGGSDASIVVLPTAVPRDEARRTTVPRFLARADVAKVTMLPHSRSDEVDSDEFRQALRQASAVWFDGGRQWRFVDAYENSDAIELFRDLLRRGGVIGGSSAGATIQGEYLVRGHPLGNRIMMAEGYERGFALLPGVAIDQHFAQRRRFVDLLPVVRRNPQMLGIGIDESTALVVSGSRGEVIGKHAVHFLTAEACAAFDQAAQAEAADDQDPSDGPQPDAPQQDAVGDIRGAYLSVPAGGVIDLQTLKTP